LAAEDISDPFQRCAIRALAGEFGPLQPWQEEAYRLGLERKISVNGRVWLTCYWDAEGHDSRWDCRGGRCGSRHLAANRLPLDTVVWLEWPVLDREGDVVGYLSQLRIVLDRGAKRNDRVADRKGCDLWADRHTNGPYPTRVGRYAILVKGVR